MVGAMFSRGSRQKVARPPLTDEQLLAAAVSALASRSRSEAELRRLLQKKLTEPGGPRIDKVVARLHELCYLSDARLAEQFVEIRQKQAHLGRRRVSQELLRRGVKADLVGDTVERAYAEVDEVALALAFVDRKRLRPPKDPRETARILRQLQRAGFSMGTCWKVVRSLASQESLAGIDETALTTDGEA